MLFLFAERQMSPHNAQYLLVQSPLTVPKENIPMKLSAWIRSALGLIALAAAAGDVIICEVDAIGRLSNPVRERVS